jgi:hypothetical protein
MKPSPAGMKVSASGKGMNDFSTLSNSVEHIMHAIAKNRHNTTRITGNREKSQKRIKSNLNN